MTRRSPDSSRSVALLLAALLAALAWALASPQSSLAHLDLVETIPADGASLDAPVEDVVLRFTVRGEAVGPGIRVLDGQGKRVPASVEQSADGTTFTATPQEPLEGGRFGVSWRVAAPDAHPKNGAFTFEVAAAPEADAAVVPASPPGADAASDPQATSPPSGGADPLAAALDQPSDDGAKALGAAGRALAYGGALFAIGGLAFLAFAMVGRRREVTRLFSLLRVAGLVALLGGAVGVVARAWLLEGGGVESTLSASALREAFRGDAGLSLTLAIVGGLLVLIGARAAFRSAPKLAVAAGDWSEHGARVVGASLRNAWLAVTGVLVLAVGAALDGHSASEGPRALVWTVDLAHTLAAGIWLGGLALLTIMLAWRRRAGRAPNAAYPAVRFSTLAGIGLGVAGLAGVVLAVIILPDVAALWESNWGRLLIAKVALVGVVAAMGVYNHFRLIPRLSRVLEAGDGLARRNLTSEPEPIASGETGGVATLPRAEVAPLVSIDEPSEVSAALRKNAAVELSLLAVVVVLTAILVGFSAV